MSENSTRLKYLIGQYSNNAATAEEEYELFGLIDETSNDEFEIVLSELFEEQQPVFEAQRTTRILNKALKQITSELVVRKLFPWKRVAAAAAIIVAIAGGSYFLLTRDNKQEIATNEPQETRFKNDVAAPKNSKATITLADGRTITLDSIAKGTLATQGNVNVVKAADGKIVYSGSTTEVAFNTLSNPRGSKVIDMTLGDGSRVWLNAGSSITYPVAFVGNERKVSITGEAYFEVKHNSSMPFKVSKGKMEITDLGTSFNVNAYDDEADMKVTLLEGSVKIIHSAQDDKGVVIKPGEQAQITNNIKIVKGVDLEEVMAWKNGRFYFDGSDIKTMMRQLSRWYNVEVEYKADIKYSFVAKISRDEPVSELLKVLELTNLVHFKIEGNKIEVVK